MAKPITVSIVGNAGPLKKAVGEAESSLDRLSGSFKKIGIATAAGFAAVGAGAVLAIGKASDLNETISKVAVVFGDANKSIEKFASDAATNLGQTRQQALDASASFGIFGKAAGLTGEKLATFSTDFTGLASDLASFNNTSPEQAINAIGAALRGESEPLRSYGVLLNDATLKQAALELGIFSGSGALTAQQKILAAQKVIYEQTGDAQGDFARTSDGLANTQRILSAQLQNVVTDIGMALLPVALKLTSVFADVLTPSVAFINEKVLPALTEQLTKVGSFITETLVPAFNTYFLPVIKTLVEFVEKNLIPAFFAFVGFIKDTLIPIVLSIAIPIFEGLSKIFTILATKIDENRETIIKYFNFLQAFYTLIKEKIAPVVGVVLKVAFEVLAKAIGPAIDVIFLFLDAFASIGSFLVKVANGVLGTIESMVNGIIAGVNKAIDVLNMLPGVDVGNVGGISISLPTISAPAGSGATVTTPTLADRVPDPVFIAPTTGTTLPTPTGSSSGGGNNGGNVGGLTSAEIAAINTGNSGAPVSSSFAYGIAERIAERDSAPTTVNITVNTVTADAGLPNLIVEQLQQYNLISGPLDVDIRGPY